MYSYECPSRKELLATNFKENLKKISQGSQHMGETLEKGEKEVWSMIFTFLERFSHFKVRELGEVVTCVTDMLEEEQTRVACDHDIP